MMINTYLKIYGLTILVALHGALAAMAGPLEFKTERFRLRLGDDGLPAELRALPGNAELLNVGTKRTGGFYLEGGNHNKIPLNQVALGADGRLTARSGDGKQGVVFSVRTADRYLALRIEKLVGIPTVRGMSLHFSMNATSRVRVTELDYMTRVLNEANGVRVNWDDIWHQVPGEPLGGFALFVKQDDADEDETLLRIWVGEHLAHPKVSGEWTLDRARTWVADWQKLFADRSQMVLEGENLDELRAALPWAEKARIKEIYLFTQTWRADGFRVGRQGNIAVNLKVFPNGEKDLRAFSDLVRSKGMRLNLHYVSGGIGTDDKTYVNTKPDRRLAGWVRGSLAQPAGVADTELRFQPPVGATYPPDLYDRCFEHDHVRIEDEIVRVGSFEVNADGTWILKKCRRGQFTTKAVAHKAGAESQGLVVPVGAFYVPDNDSTLLTEIATNFAGFINRCGISHTEYDGAEIHTYNGRWGYRKFATIVYENLDHPVTAHDSSGSVPRCNFEYRFNRSQQIFRGTCHFTHGNWSAAVELASPSRVASTLLDANFALSQGHYGGAMGLNKPEPKFAVSEHALKTHGLSEQIIKTLLDWKAVSPLLTDAQHAQIDASFGQSTNRMPERSKHHQASRLVQTVRKTATGYQIVPVAVMTRKSGDIQWTMGQEHGAISPQQFIKTGEELTLENPFAAQPMKFIIRVLWAFDPHGPTETLKRTGKPAVKPAQVVDLTTDGNDAPLIAQTSVVPNIMLQPTLADLRVTKDTTPKNPARVRSRMLAEATLKTRATIEDQALRLQAENPGAEELWADPKRLPEWGAPMDMTWRRGIGMRVTGDGSGALLVLMISGRDYVIPIDFKGPRDIEIPNGEAAWATNNWGWRVDTKRADYSRQHWCRLGFGSLPPNSKSSVRVEAITALAEIPTVLENPVIRTGSGTLTVKGTIASGQYLQFDGGDTAGVFDDNWNKVRDLPVVKKDYVMPKGWAPVTVTAGTAKAKPWLDVQFLAEGEPMIVRQ